MKLLIVGILACAALSGCASSEGFVYSSGFSFANYDSVMVVRPDASQGAVFGLDIEFANMLTRHKMKVVGEKELEALPPEAKARTLIARLAVVPGQRSNLFSITFDNAATGATVASFNGEAEGNMLSKEDRTEAFEFISEEIGEAIADDKGISPEG